MGHKELNALVVQQREQHLPLTDRHLEPQLGMGVLQLGQALVQESVDRQQAGAEMQFPALPAGNVQRIAAHVFFERQQFTRLRQKACAGRRHKHRAGMPIKKLEAQFLFQRLDAATERRLR